MKRYSTNLNCSDVAEGTIRPLADGFFILRSFRDDCIATDTRIQPFRGISAGRLARVIAIAVIDLLLPAGPLFFPNQNYSDHLL